MKKTKRLLDEYRFPGFCPSSALKGKFGDNKAIIIPLNRVQKKLFAVVVALSAIVFMTRKKDWSGIYLVAMPEFFWNLRCGGLTV